MSKNAKRDRGQLRQIVQETLPEVLKDALIQEAYDRLKGEIDLRLRGIETQLREALTRMDNRAKEVQDFLVRQVTVAPPAAAPEAFIKEKKDE